MDGEEDQYDRDIRGLEQCWRAFIQEMNDGANGHIHPPPALMRAVQNCWLVFTKHSSGEDVDVTTYEPPPDMIVDVPAVFLTLYGATMFEYGQRSLSWGLHVQNMDPCRCDIVDDNELDHIVSEWGKETNGT